MLYTLIDNSINKIQNTYIFSVLSFLANFMFAISSSVLPFSSSISVVSKIIINHNELYQTREIISYLFQWKFYKVWRLYFNNKQLNLILNNRYSLAMNDKNMLFLTFHFLNLICCSCRYSASSATGRSAAISSSSNQVQRSV